MGQINQYMGLRFEKLPRILEHIGNANGDVGGEGGIPAPLIMF